MPNVKDDSFIFLDPRGKRWPRLRLSILIIGLVCFVCSVLFVQSLFVTPQLRLPSSVLRLKARLKALQKHDQPQSVSGPKRLWLQFHKKSSSKAPQKTPNHPIALSDKARSQDIRLGFYAVGSQKSFQSLKKHAGQLTHVCPEWMSVLDGRGTIEARPDEQVQKLAKKTGLTLLPMLNNLSSEARVPEAVEGLAGGPEERRSAFIANLVERLESAGAGGVVIDWGEIDPAYRKGLTVLLGEISAALHLKNMELWLCIPMGTELKAFDLEALSSCVDHFIAMLHDENSEKDPPGPIASRDWFKGWLLAMADYGNPSQWVISIGSYGYDWASGEPKGEMISFPDVMARAAHAGLKECKPEGPSYNPHFSYEDAGTMHTVWFLDAATFLNQARKGSKRLTGGVAITQLGWEDPAIWEALPLISRDHLAVTDLAPLQQLKSGDSITHIGRGDFLTVDDSRADGFRTIEIDPSGRIVERYEAFPSYLTVSHQGRSAGDEVAITFDDGPDPEWTPQILDILKKEGVKAAFFVIGQKAEDHPGLLQRIVQEGHELGVHTYTHPNLAQVSEERAQLEFNATQRLIEILTGRSTILFRPPYNADSYPATLQEILPVKLAQESGYLTVAESVDPEDWSLPGAAEILKKVKRLRRGGGDIVLLHDAGGDRSQTVEALPGIIDYLRARGDRIVSLGEMLRETRDHVMPPLGNEQPMTRMVSGGGFHVLYIVENFAWAFMIVATGLIVFRTLFIVSLAAVNRRKTAQPREEDFFPPLSILIPAYNEEKVIAGTLDALLGTSYPGEIEVVVVDDGSTDGTALEVERIAEMDPRLRLIRQPNQGKALAIVRGIEALSHEILVTLDADTHFQRDTLQKLVQPMKDESVGGVSGHAKVGNLRSFIARCQALEYTCGFNLERRACHELNGITVVPGAVSALRLNAVARAGGVSTDTLAEDTDLTLCLHREGYRIAYVPDALAWTEAPETIRALAKQRFRWTFGTLQCLWKHRDMVFDGKYKALGWFSLPSVWFFHILLAAIGPMVDATLIVSLLAGVSDLLYVYFVAFLAMDFFLALLALYMEREPLRNAWIAFPMRLIYRPLLSWVIWKSVFKALKGVWVNWGKLERTASVVGPGKGTSAGYAKGGESL